MIYLQLLTVSWTCAFILTDPGLRSVNNTPPPIAKAGAQFQNPLPVLTQLVRQWKLHIHVEVCTLQRLCQVLEG